MVSISACFLQRRLISRLITNYSLLKLFLLKTYAPNARSPDTIHSTWGAVCYLNAGTL